MHAEAVYLGLSKGLNNTLTQCVLHSILEMNLNLELVQCCLAVFHRLFSNEFDKRHQHLTANHPIRTGNGIGEP